MADTHSTTQKTPEDHPIGASAPDPATPEDQHLIIRMEGDCFVEYFGTRAMLEAEGIIPKDTDWPQGYHERRWKDGRFDYWLRRERPKGAKGPRRQFIDCDWWCLRWELPNKPSWVDLNIKNKEEELRAFIYRNSVEGRAKRNAAFVRYLKACDDAKFQAFKAAIPGLVARKRGRRSKSADQPQGAKA